MIISRRLFYQNSKWKKLGSCNYWTKNSTVAYSPYYDKYVVFEKCSGTSYVSFTSDFLTFKTFSSTVHANIDSKTGQVFYVDDSSGRPSSGSGFTAKCVVGYIDKNYSKKEKTIDTVQPIGSGYGFLYLTEIHRMGDYLIFNYATCSSPSASGLGQNQNWAQKYAYSNDNGVTWKIVTIGHGENVKDGRYDDVFSFGYYNGKYIVYAEFDTCYKFLEFTSPTKYTAYEVAKTYGSNPYYGDTFYLNGAWYIADNYRGYKSTDGHTFLNIQSNIIGWINKSTIYLSDIKKYLAVKERTGIRLYDETFTNFKEIGFPSTNKLNSLLGVINGNVYVQTNDKYIYSAPLEDLIK